LKKKICNILLFVLLFWFFLDMVGLNIGGKVLVSRAYMDDGIFFIIYFLILLLYFYKNKIGYFFLISWLFLWFVTQFFSHWYYTIIGSTEKMSYFSETIKLFQSAEIYIADIYHIILHILILFSFVCLICKYPKMIKSK